MKVQALWDRCGEVLGRDPSTFSQQGETDWSPIIDPYEISKENPLLPRYDC